MTAQFEINAPTDGVLDGIKTVELALTVSGSVVNVVDGLQTLTILDADALRPSLTLDTVAPIDEGTSRVVTARLLNGNLTTPLTITVETTLASDPTSAADSLDYSLSATTIEIPANSLDVTFTITITDDDVYEGDEQFILSLKPVGDKVDLGTVTRTVTIRDNDNLPTLSLDEVGPLSESPAAAILTLRLSRAIKFTTTVSLSVVGGDADMLDYNLLQPSVEIGAGELTATAELRVVDDELYEGPETLRLRLTGRNAIVSFVPFEQTIQLVDADPIPSVSLESIGPVTEAGGVSVVVALAVPAKFTITVSLTHGVASTADVTDYRVEPSSVKIPAGQTTATVSFYAEDDNLYELPETVQLDLRAFRDVTLLSEASAAITIIDNTQTPSVSFGALATTDAIEEGTLLNIALILTGAVSTVDLTVALEASGTATEGDDYDRLPTLITIPAGKRTTTVELRTIDDLIDEDTETVVLDLRQVANGPRIGSPSQITIMIADNDLPTPEATLSSNTLSLTENETGTLEIVLTAVAAVDVTFTLEYLSGTADGADYRLTPDVVLIPAGADSATVSIFVEDDNYAEVEESLRLRLTSVSSGITVGAQRVVTVTITDNDDVQVKIEGSALSVDERNPASGAALSVELTNAPNGAPEELIVDLAARGDDGGTADDVRIVDDNDMEITQVTIAAGASRAIFFVQAVDDDDLEYAETVNIYASAINSKAITDSGYDLAVLSDEGLLSGITVQDGTEGETVRAQITLSHLLPAQVPSGALSLVLLDGTTMNADVKILPRDIVADLKASKTTEVTIELTDDLLVEGVEEFTVTLRIDSTLMPDLTALFELIPSPSSFTITDNDDEAPPPVVIDVTATLSEVNLTVPEGEDRTFEILLSDIAPEDLTFTLVGGPVGEYSLSPDPIVISKGATSVIVTVTALEDVDAELDEVFTLSLMSESSLVIIDAPSSITVTIPENDQPTTPVLPSAVTATLSLPTLSVPEGEARTFEILLSDIAPEDLTFTLVGGPVGEYSLSPDPIVISKGATSVIVTVTALEDVAAELDEVFTLSLMSESSLVIIDAPSSITVTIPENDQPTTPVLPSAVTATLSLPTLSVPEGEARTFEILLSDIAPEDLTFTLVGGPVGEYSLSPDPIVISKGATSVIVTVMALEDVDAESDEVFTLSLMSSSSLVIIDAPSSITVTIPENDQPTTPVLPSAVTATLSLPTLSVPEGEARTFEILLSDIAPEDLTFTLVGGPVGEYSLSPDPIVISKGATSVIVTVTALEDVDAELDEVFTLSLMSDPSSSLVIIDAPSSITVTIPENDQTSTPVLPSAVTATLSLPTLSVPEGEARTFEILLSDIAPEDLTFTLVGGPVGEYSLSPDPIVISKGATSVIVTVTALEDVDAELDEVFTLSLMSDPSSSLVIIDAPSSITVTIPENDQPPAMPVLPSAVTATLSLPTLSVPEGEARTFEIRLTDNAPEDLTFTLVGGPSGEYTLSPDPIVISKGSNNVIVTVTAVDDGDAELDEVFTLSLMSDPASSLVIIDAPSSITVTIPENDQSPPPPEATKIAFVVTSASIDEGEVYEIELHLVDDAGNPLSHSQDISATLAVFDAGRSLDLNEFMFSSTVNIPAGRTTGYARFTSKDDLEIETDEKVTFWIPAVDALGVLSDRAMFTITVRDNDVAVVDVTATLRMPTLDIAENETKELFIELSEAPVSDVTVKLTRVSGEATESDDYSLSSQQLTFTPTGAQELTISISSIADMLYEGIETVEFELSVLSGPAVVGATDRVTVTIADGDTVPTLSLEPATPSVTEGQKTTVQAVLSGALDEDVEVSLAVTDDTADTADYTLPTTLRVTIPAGETSVAFDITAAVDGIYEGDPETLILTLSTTNSTVLNGNLVRTLTIMDLDTQPTLSLEGVMNVSEGAGTLTLTARLDGALDIPVPIMLSTGGTATENDDYTFPSSLTIPAGVRVLAIAITIIDDDVHENDETVELTLSVLGGEVLTGTVMGTFTIMNDDPVPGVSASTNTPVTEGGNIEVTITLDSPSSIATPVTLMIAPGLNAESDDFTGMDQLTMEIPAGMTSVTFIIGTEDDEFYEGAETIDIRPSVSGSNLPVESVVITDNDDAPTVEFTMGTSTENEGATANVEVRLDGKRSESPVEVIFTVSGTATPGDDYTLPTMLRVTIPAKMRPGMITFAIQDEDRYDGVTETVILTLSSASNAVGAISLGATTVHTLMIDDQQDQPTLSLELSAPSVTEGQMVTVEAVLNGALDEDVVVALDIMDGTAGAADYTLLTMLDATIAAGTTTAEFTIMANTDNTYEGDPETLMLTLSTTNSEVINGNLDRTLTIMDADDLPTLSLEGVMNVNEGAGTLTLTARLSVAVDVDVEVTLAVGGAVTTADYTLATPMMTIDAGAETATFVLVITDDKTSEGNEIWTLSLSGRTAENEALATIERMLTITDNDGAPTISLDPVATVTEGGNIEIVVNLIGTSTTEIEVTLELLSTGTAMENADYTVPSHLRMMIPVDGTEARFTVVTVDDELYEGTTPETLAFRVTSSNAGGGPLSGEAMIRDNDDAPTVIFTASSSSVTEGGSANVEVSLVGKLSESDVVVYFTVDSTTATGDDYTSPVTLATGVTIAAGTRTATITFDISVDSVYDGSAPETVLLTLSSASNAVGTIALGATTVHTLTITDAQPTAPTLSLEPDAPSVTEGGSVIFTATLTGALDEPVEVLLTVTGGDATTADYRAPAMLRVTIPAGETRVAFVITAAVDGIYEGAPETVEFTLSAPNGEVTGTALEQTLTIMDGDDLPTLSLEGVTDVPEGVGTLILTARLSGVLDVDVDVTLAVNEAVYMDDYMLLIPTMTISAGAETVTFELVITDDTLYEGDERLTLSLSGRTATNEALTTIERMLTITDNDMVVIGFDPDTYTVNEDAGTVELTVKVLAGSLMRDVTLTYDTMDGTATAPGDYTAVSMGTVMLSAGATEKKIVLTITDDSNIELSEMFTVVLSGAPAGVMLDPSVATVTITDDVVIGFDPDTYTVNEDAGTVELTVKVLAGSLTRDVTLTYDTMDGTATAGEDYTAVSMGTVTLLSSETEKKIVLSIIDDSNVELSEMFTVVLSGATAGVMLDPSMATVTITDDVVIGFSGSPYVVSEAAGGVTITVDIAGRLTGAVTLGVEYVPGTASETEDYTPLTSEIQLSAGATRATLFVQIVNDELYENADTFSVRLVEPNGGLPLRVKLATGSAEADVTITNDDEIEIGFVEGMYTFLENQRRGTAQVRYSGSEIAPGVTVTVSYATTVQIGDSIDINDVSGMLMLISGQRVYNINFPITDDNAFNRATERYTVSLETLDMNSGLTFRLDRVSASLNVLTDDVLDFGFSVTEYEVNEDAGTVELEVSVLRNTIGAGESVVVRYSTTPGSATSVDFEPVMMGEVTLSSMSTVARFTIQIIDDDILEDSESFVVTLTKADGRDTLQLLQSKATVTILDDNDPVTIGFGRASYSVTEGAGAVVNLDVGVLSGGLERDITLEYDIRGGSAIAGTDYEYMTGTVTLSSDASKPMISISLLNDDIFDPDETFTVVLTGHDGPSTLTLAPASAIVTIVDAGPVPTISLDPVADVTEGNSRDVIARLSGKLNRDVTVILTATNGTAESDDYTLAVSRMVIPAGSLLATFTVNTNQDPLYEDNETVNLGLSIVSGEVDLGTPVTRVLTINNDDSVTIGFQETTYRVMEGAVNAMVRVAVLTGQIASDVNIDVRYSTSNDTAMAGSDYTAVSGMLRFNSANTQQTVMIPIENDDIYEDAEERFTIGLNSVSSPARVSVSPATSEILITDDDKPTLTIEIEGGVKELEEGESVVVTVRLSNMAANPIMISLTTLATTTSATIGTVESGDYTISPADRMIPVGARSVTFALRALDDGLRELDEILALQASATGLESVSRELTIPGAVDAIIEPTRPPRTFQACETVDSGVQACVEVPKETVSMSTVTLEIDKVDQDQKNNIIAPAELPPATALLDEILIWDIRFMDDNDIVVETLSNTVQIELTASKAIVDEYGGPQGVSIATLHSGSTEWVALPTSYTSTVEMTPTGKEKYRFTAFSQNFSLFTLIVPVTATLSPSAASIQEGQSIDLVITLSAPAGEDIVFNLSKVGGDAVEGTHYSLPASITIIAGERSARVPLTTIYDFNSRSETLEIELSVRGTAAIVGLMNRATITITDDPPPVATLDVGEIQEGASTVVTYELSHGRARVPITVSLRDVAGTSDIRITPASITLAPGETTAEFNLMAICDILPEGVETLTLEAISTELGSVRTMLDVRDIMLDIESVTELDEDDRAVVRVRLSSAGCNPTTVSLTAIGGTADVDDYTLSQPSVTLDGADTIAEFRLTAHDDSQREQDETLVLVASVAGLNSVTATITIIDLVEDDFGLLPPTGGLAFPLWLVAVLLLTGLTLVVGTVYVVRRPRSAPRV